MTGDDKTSDKTFRMAVSIKREVKYPEDSTIRQESGTGERKEQMVVDILLIC